MENIKVGEYVRLARNQGINRLEEIDGDFYIFEDFFGDDYGEETTYMHKNKVAEEVLKHSPNIIDLIEVGDYVNGYKVKDIRLWNTFFNGKHEYKLDFGELGTMESGEIRSIVTHEQFENMKYVVGDK